MTSPRAGLLISGSKPDSHANFHLNVCYAHAGETVMRRAECPNCGHVFRWQELAKPRFTDYCPSCKCVIGSTRWSSIRGGVIGLTFGIAVHRLVMYCLSGVRFESIYAYLILGALIAILLAVLVCVPIFLLSPWFTRVRVKDSHPHCTHCGYDITGVEPDKCPECGRWIV